MIKRSAHLITIPELPLNLRRRYGLNLRAQFLSLRAEYSSILRQKLLTEQVVSGKVFRVNNREAAIQNVQSPAGTRQQRRWIPVLPYHLHIRPPILLL